MRATAVDFDGVAAELRGLCAEMRTDGGGLIWTGADSDRFRQLVADAANVSGAAVARQLDELAIVLRQQAVAQDDVSASLDSSGGARGGSSGVQQAERSSDGPHSTRFDTPEARAASLDRNARFLQSGGARQYFPGAFGAADQWLKELQAGSPTAEQVQGFESFIAMIKLANLNRGVVMEAANTAYAEYVEMARSVGGAAGGASDVAGGSSGGQIAEELIKGEIDRLIDHGIDGIIDQTGGVAAGAQGLIDTYNSSADAYVMSLLDNAKTGGRVGSTDSSRLAFLEFNNLRSQYDGVSVTIEKADAFTLVTGDDSAIDTALRTTMKVISPPAGKALDGLAIAGGGAQAAYHYEAGTQALNLASSGAMDSLMGLSQTLRLS